jgi:formate/nitrite transporter FocA (FNT family)
VYSWCPYHEVSKIFSIWICIVMFISSGFEHIVVNQLLCPLGEV